MSTSAPEDTLHCARHPGTETVLRCGRCDTPICPRCLVSTPVGARCPTCARVKRFTVLALIRPRELMRAVLFGLGVAVIGTIVLGYIPFLGLIGFALMGFGVGEAVAIGVNRKRARELGPVAVACVFIGYELGTIIALEMRFGGALPLGPGVLIASFRGVTVIGLLVGALLAWMRVR